MLSLGSAGDDRRAGIFHAAVAAAAAGSGSDASCSTSRRAFRRCSRRRSTSIGRRSSGRRTNCDRCAPSWQSQSSDWRRKASRVDRTTPSTQREQLVERKQNELDDIVQRPTARPAFPNLNGLSRWMVRLRYRLFGEWSLGSICGRDEFGRDLLSRVFWGARISLIVGIVATLVSLRDRRHLRRDRRLRRRLGRRRDDAVRRRAVLDPVHLRRDLHHHDSQRGRHQARARPAGASTGSRSFTFVVGAIYWLTMARVVRGQVISLKTEPFVEAARAIGASQTRIICGTSCRTW